MPEQPHPSKGREAVFPVAKKLFSDLLEERHAKGIATYGTELETFNGRSAARDLAEELVDAFQYAMQLMMEHHHLKAENERLSVKADLLEKENARLMRWVKHFLDRKKEESQ